mmetsp:Transcript_22646/g.38640  ORF Transcript_22646/g.38640 Transcript_22646/m.38640 type:complete len:119 (+) Transcript_22646:1-357(+)
MEHESETQQAWWTHWKKCHYDIIVCYRWTTHNYVCNLICTRALHHSIQHIICMPSVDDWNFHQEFMEERSEPFSFECSVIDADARTIRYWRFQVNKAVLLSQLLQEVSLCRTQQRAKL